MEEDEQPVKYTLKYIESLPEEEREAAHAVRREQLRVANLEGVKAYQKRNKDKVNAYRREWRKKKKEEKILAEAKRIENERKVAKK